MTTKSSRIDLNPTKEMAQSFYVVVNVWAKMLTLLKPLLASSVKTHHLF
jgi:hypothetical protein